jgi:hypothetical protein
MQKIYKDLSLYKFIKNHCLLNNRLFNKQNVGVIRLHTGLDCK